jgi:hypothetical protein
MLAMFILERASARSRQELKTMSGFVRLSWLEHIGGSLAQSPICQDNFLLKLNAISLNNVFGY